MLLYCEKDLSTLDEVKGANRVLNLNSLLLLSDVKDIKLGFLFRLSSNFFRASPFNSDLTLLKISNCSLTDKFLH